MSCQGRRYRAYTAAAEQGGFVNGVLAATLTKSRTIGVTGPVEVGDAKTYIAGFSQGVIGMRVGGQRRVIIPPSLGYGSSGSGAIPGNAHIIFEVELLSVAG